MAQIWLRSFLPIFFSLLFSDAFGSATFTFLNKCDQTVWPGLLSNAGIAPLSTTGFSLQIGESRAVSAPQNWGGRFWGRTLCGVDASGKFTCATADCGSGTVECSGGNAAPPATLAEFTLDGGGGMDFYDVSLVDGYNLPLLVVPQGGSGQKCTSTGCSVDLNAACPSELGVISGNDNKRVACKSACEAFGDPQYCCSGAYSTPDTCKPSAYSELFKSACPRAYSYAYDDQSSTFTCTGADYLIIFCPSPNTSQKSSNGQTQVEPSNSPAINSSMVYQGALDSSSAKRHVSQSQALTGTFIIIMLIYQLKQFV